MTPAQSGKSSRAFVNLDFIRSVAVLLVAASHLLLYLGLNSYAGWSGVTGVCIFFVHTSLVLMWSLQRDGNVARFYLRRAFRIYPLWLVVLALTVWVRLPMSPVFAPQFRFLAPGWREFLANAALFNRQYGMRVVGASWTLPIEMQMYVFLPLLFFFARRLRHVWLLILLDLLVMGYDYLSHGPMNSSLSMCVPYFLPGIMAFVMNRRRIPLALPSWSFALFFFFLIGIDHFYGSFRHSWLFSLALGLGLPWFREISWRPVQVASHYIARYSYGVYLTHIAAICVSVYVLRAHSLGLRIAAFVALFIGLPVVFYHLVEEPMIRLGARLAGHIGSGKAPRVTDKTLELEMAP